MKTISAQARFTSAVLAVLTTAVLLGGTAAGITSGAQDQTMMLVAMERVTVIGTAAN
jgi:hypothetical protein